VALTGLRSEPYRISGALEVCRISTNVNNKSEVTLNTKHAENVWVAGAQPLMGRELAASDEEPRSRRYTGLELWPFGS